MEIKIELDNERVNNNILVITDKGFDSAENWVSLKLIHGLSETIELLGDVRINDLMPALIAFDAKNSRKTIED